jgi:diacylglycerol kinase (ATP)
VKIGLILNGISLRKKSFYKELLPILKKNFTVDVFETHSRNHAFDLAGKTVYKKYDLIIAAGGDGTVHQVVNGLLQEQHNTRMLPPLAILPLGSGNDFAHAVGATKNINLFIEKIKAFQLRSIDVGEITCRRNRTGLETKTRYFVNVADTGMGPEVVSRLSRNGRPFGSAIAYYESILATFFSYTPKVLSASSTAFEWNDRVRTFAIANGKYFGSGLCIAPDAILDDGTFNIFAVGPVSVLDFILQSVPLKLGRRINHSHVNYFTCQEVQLKGDEDLSIETDGEFCGWLPAVVKLSAAKLTILKMN